MMTSNSQAVSQPFHKSFSRLAALVAVMILIAAQVGATAKQPVRRIKFKPGTTSARVKGRLRGRSDKAVYLIRVNAGQHMVAEVQSKNYAKVEMISPSGQSGDQDMQGTHTGVDSTEAGDYRIIVTENPKADPWKGIFYLNVTVL
jgi:FlaG/FlaF family flagellin (archaellin)